MGQGRLWLGAGVVLAVFALSPCALAQTGAVVSAQIFNGKPTFSESTELGYYVWRDGQRWHVRWTTKGTTRHFSGSVAAEGGVLKSLKRIGVETQSQVLVPGRTPTVVVGPRGRAHVRTGRAPVVATRQEDKIERDGDSRIVFSAKTEDDTDGFDFGVSDKVKTLRFVLEVGGKQMPQRIEIGETNQKPDSTPVVVQLE